VNDLTRTVGAVVTYLQQLAADNPEAAEAIRARFDKGSKDTTDYAKLPAQVGRPPSVAGPAVYHATRKTG
jgi:hypothetical protein